MNISGVYILSAVTFLPLFGAIWIMTLRDDEHGHGNARWLAFYVTMMTFALSLYICWGLFDPSSPKF